jgi:hypothetical protein
MANSLSLRRSLVRVVVLLCLSASPALADPVTVAVDWQRTINVSKSTATLQVVVNPLLRRNSPIYKNVFSSLRQLGADYVRYVPWLAYPRLAVAELQKPTNGKTSWDFSLIDPMTVDFMKATAGHKSVVNFSTMPAWLFNTEKPVSYPENPDQVEWTYTQGNQLSDSSAQQVADYYARLFSWYVKDGFTDELGRYHKSNYHFDIPYWEVLNEPDIEHALSPEQYTLIYDAIVSRLRKISPITKFVGASLAFPERHLEMFEYFLNKANHLPGIPIDMISYHFYAIAAPRETPADWQYSFFDQADGFVNTVRYIEAIRKRLSPSTGTMVNEVGTMLSSDVSNYSADIPREYWNISGAVYAYLYTQLSKIGIDVIGQSQLVGFPSQYPSVSMVDWSDGTPNARYWIMKLIKDNFGPGDLLMATITSDISNTPDVVAQGFVTGTGRKLLLINRRAWPADVHLAPVGTVNTLQVVDQSTDKTTPTIQVMANPTVHLNAFAVAVVTFQ